MSLASVRRPGLPIQPSRSSSARTCESSEPPSSRLTGTHQEGQRLVVGGRMVTMLLNLASRIEQPRIDPLVGALPHRSRHRTPSQGSPPTTVTSRPDLLAPCRSVAVHPDRAPARQTRRSATARHPRRITTSRVSLSDMTFNANGDSPAFADGWAQVVALRHLEASASGTISTAVRFSVRWWPGALPGGEAVRHVRYFGRKCTSIRPKLWESFSTRS